MCSVLTRMRNKENTALKLLCACKCVLCFCSVYGFHTILHPLCFPHHPHPTHKGLRALKCIQPQSLLFSTWTVSSAVLGVKLQLKVCCQAQNLKPGAFERRTTFRWNLSLDFCGILAKTCLCSFWESGPRRKKTQDTSNCCKLTQTRYSSILNQYAEPSNAWPQIYSLTRWVKPCVRNVFVSDWKVMN